MIYLDHNATTPFLPEVFEAMRPCFCEQWEGPSIPRQFNATGNL
jgi:cysteine sulfinate desulfinase/cysteine desulfurase-like protein